MRDNSVLALEKPLRFSTSFSVPALVATLLITSLTAFFAGTPKTAFSAGSQAFSNTGSDQTWTVPSGVTEVQVYVRGAAGGTDQYNYGIGGKGAYVSAVLAVTPGDTLTIVAGSKGRNGAGGMNATVYGGGGTYSANVWYTTSGGGASDIRIGGSAVANRAVVAGGGGGGVSFQPGGNAGTPTPGGDGTPASPSGLNAGGGKGGTQSAGGAGGLRSSGCSGSLGTAGSLGQGGAAGTTGGSGGGGGYYGGGGGAMECNAGSGGGGSSWINSSLVSSATYALAANATSAGCVEIAWPVGTAASSCVGVVNYSVTYNGNTNTSGSAPTDGTAYTSGQNVTVATNSGSLQKTGYSFNGWCTAQPAAGATCASVSGTSRATSSTFAIAASTTLYAVWVAASQTITYANNLGTGTIANTTGNTGVTVSLNSGASFNRSGYTLGSWNTASGGSGTSYALNASITMPAGGLALFAQWTANATTTTSTTTTTTTTSTTSTTTIPATTISSTTVAPAAATTTSSSTTTSSTTSSTTSTTVAPGSVGVNSWSIDASENPVSPGSRFVLTTTISCGKQMSTSARPYYPSMYYMVSSAPWINGVYRGPSLSADRRTATFSVTVTAPSTPGTYKMYAYGRDNPTGGTCTGDSFNFSNSAMFTLVVGDPTATTTTLTQDATATTGSTMTTILVMPTITTTTSSTTTSTTTPATTSSLIPITASTTATTPVVQLDISSSIQLPQNSTDMMVSRDSLMAIVERLQITSGTIRVKTSDSAWQELDVQNISDLVFQIGNDSSSLEIEVLQEGSTTPVAYSVPITTKDRMPVWPNQVLIFLVGLASLWFFVFNIRRRRNYTAA